MRMLWAGVVWIAICLLTACGEPALNFSGLEVENPGPAPDFTLTDQFGNPFTLSEQQGQVVLLFFGYVSCPDVCPTTLGIWRLVHQALGDDAARVRFVFVTVDPARDTPARMREHLAIFNPDFIGLTGSDEELERVYEAYGVVHDRVEAPDSALGYLVNHTASDFAIDTQGHLRVRHVFGSTADEIAHDVRLMLQ
jgi:protein SCO1